jgi:hypothetical protein
VLGDEDSPLFRTPTYRPVEMRVRPAKVATVMPSQLGWHEHVLSVLECYSRTWGGLGDFQVHLVPLCFQEYWFGLYHPCS